MRYLFLLLAIGCGGGSAQPNISTSRQLERPLVLTVLISSEEEEMPFTREGVALAVEDFFEAGVPVEYSIMEIDTPTPMPTADDGIYGAIRTHLGISGVFVVVGDIDHPLAGGQAPVGCPNAFLCHALVEQHSRGSAESFAGYFTHEVAHVLGFRHSAEDKYDTFEQLQEHGVSQHTIDRVNSTEPIHNLLVLE